MTAAAETIVVKLGGSVGQEDTVPEDLAALRLRGFKVVVVHGGGPVITSWLSKLGIETHFVDGLRYTDGPTLDVVCAVLGGLVNGQIVGRIGAAGVPAIGLSGGDGSLLLARQRDERLGLVGDIVAVNPAPVGLVLDAGYVAVVAPVAASERGGFLNVNADTAAAELAVALNAERLIYLTDVDGISDGRGPIRRLDEMGTRHLIQDGVIVSGMIPKAEGCLRALDGVHEAWIVNGRQPHVLITAAEGGCEHGTVFAAPPITGR